MSSVYIVYVHMHSHKTSHGEAERSSDMYMEGQ